MQSLADSIMSEDIDVVRAALQYPHDLNQLDEYGFTPLIEAAIADNVAIAQLLISYGANVNLPDMTGSSPLHWAVENNNLQLCSLLLANRANPNAYTLSGQPVLTLAVLRQQHDLKRLLLDHGASLEFAQDYINTKMLGHIFELVGTTNIVSPNNQFVEVDFEGFFLEVSLDIIADSLLHFKNHFAAREVRHYGQLSQMMVDVLQRATQLIQFQQYRTNIAKHTVEINHLIQQEPLLIPVGYEGHAITFIKFGTILVKCDRREDSRLYDNIMFYEVGNKAAFTAQFIKKLIYDKQSDHFVNVELPAILQLMPITELKVPAQISGNCSWANVEACIPTLHFLMSTYQADFQKNIARYKSLALKYFYQWREWNKDRTMNFCIQALGHGDSLRKICKAEILAAILFQSSNNQDKESRSRIETLLAVLTRHDLEYILQNYIKVYCYEDHSEEGKNFLQLLRTYGYDPARRR